jgi:hypothetical protein
LDGGNSSLYVINSEDLVGESRLLNPAYAVEVSNLAKEKGHRHDVVATIIRALMATPKNIAIRT